MVTYQEFHLRGRIAGFSDAQCEWTLRVYEDETLTASIAPAPHPPSHESIAALALFNGQASQSSSPSVFIMRFQLVQHTASPAHSWTIDCNARLDLATAVVSGTWSHAMATRDWPRPRSEMECDNYDFQLERTCTSDGAAESTGTVRSLRPLYVGRYVFRGVVVDGQAASARPAFVDLLVKDGDELEGRLWLDHERRRSLRGTRGRGICTWMDDQGLLVNAQVDNVLLIGAWAYDAGPSGWFELVAMSVMRQWRWEDHAKTPLSLQNAFAACHRLDLRGLDDGIWRQIFSYCDYDWFEA